MKINSEYTVLNIFVSSVICIVLYLITAMIFLYDGINLNEDPAGVIALLIYFFGPFITIQALELEILK